jgi:hypothetical protein
MTERVIRLVRRSFSEGGILGIVVSVVVATAGPASAQDVRPAEQAYRNIQVMKGVPANQVIQGMHMIKASLGVDCEFCHVPMQFDKDDIAMKTIARRMYQMVTEINRANFNGRQVVGCYTCHKGHAIPEDVPSLPAPAVPPVAAAAAPKPQLPTVEQVLAKYVAALGGEQAIRKVTSRVITASEEVPTGPGGSVPTPATLTRSMKAPNLVVDVHKGTTLSLSNGFDGTAAWARGMNGNVTSPPPGTVDAGRARRAAAFYEPLTLNEQYPTLTVDGTATINGRMAYVLTGTPANDVPEMLYFDVQTGLLLRKSNYLVTAVGRSPFQIDYEDYRDTGSGVKIPFVVHMLPAGMRTEIETASTIHITGVKDNVPLDAALFVKPEQLTRPAP